MSKFLCITVRFLQPLSHGRGDGDEPEWPPSPLRARNYSPSRTSRQSDEPEWPPSPLRVFQALVAAAAGRWNERMRLEYAVPALEWLAKQPAPTVVAAVGVPSDVKYRLYVPDNVGDKVAKSWRSGNVNASIADYRTEKDVRPTHLTGDAVHYLHSIPDSDSGLSEFKQTLIDAARSITHLGWGVDMVAGNAVEMTEEKAAKLTKEGGECWRPTKDGSGTPLRVPRAGTLDALMKKHEAFLNRLADDGFRPVPPLTAFTVVGYRRDSEPASRPWVAFRIASVDPDDANPSFDTSNKCRDVAAWLRCAVAAVCERWPFPDFASFVHGHDENGSQLKGEHADQRFMYLPLPTINAKLRRVDSIRRVLVAAPPDRRDRIDWLRLRLPGQELLWNGDGKVEEKGVLNSLSASDWVLQQYTAASRVWSTVTPVVLHRHEVGGAEICGLLKDAFRHAGFSEEVVDRLELDWRGVGFRAGVDLATRYLTPDTTTGPRYHVRVQFAHPVRGPLAVGAGRYRGMGLFAMETH
ncbi:MAG: type I-U CRISPR-associated protein Csb2 [Planctomycetia bacterium]|nr:type I-U CRISPR-associated protein Csb2 [Planctomycetia bacterium]